LAPIFKKTTLDNSIPLKTEDDIINAVERFNQTEQQAAWSATPTSSNFEIHIEYSSAIKEKIAEKRKLRKPWQINRCLILKNKKSNQIIAIKSFKNLLYMDRSQSI